LGASALYVVRVDAKRRGVRWKRNGRRATGRALPSLTKADFISLRFPRQVVRPGVWCVVLLMVASIFRGENPDAHERAMTHIRTKMTGA
jgi:hypothetical protein